MLTAQIWTTIAREILRARSWVRLRSWRADILSSLQNLDRLHVLRTGHATPSCVRIEMLGSAPALLSVPRRPRPSGLNSVHRASPREIARVCPRAICYSPRLGGYRWLTGYPPFDGQKEARACPRTPLNTYFTLAVPYAPSPQNKNRRQPVADNTPPKTVPPPIWGGSSDTCVRHGCYVRSYPHVNGAMPHGL